MKQGGILMLLMVAFGSATIAQNEIDLAYEVELLYEIPYVTSVVWDNDGRMFFTQKKGNVYLAEPDGSLQKEPVVSVHPRVFNEDGLQSIVLDPNFDENRHFYIYYTEADAAPDDPENDLRNLVVRYTEFEGRGIDPVIMLEFQVEDSGTYQHNGGRLRFGPDDYLYLSVGDLNHYNVFAQDINRIEGKIHRFAVMDSELQSAPDNSFPNSSTWAYGLRNVFSYVFDPYSEFMFSTENGPDCDDEINRIIPGENYGWGIIELPDSAAYEGYCERPERHTGAIEPLVTYEPTIAPTGIMIYDGKVFPEWQGQLFFCAFKTYQMHRVELDETRTNFVGEVKVVSTGAQPNCAIEIAQGPDDLIYYTNTLGIYRLTPAK